MKNGEETTRYLTKREAMAMAAMQGIISGSYASGSQPDGLFFASEAVRYADALLKELEKKKE